MKNSPAQDRRKIQGNDAHAISPQILHLYDQELNRKIKGKKSIELYSKTTNMETADNFDPQLQNELLTMETNICKVVIALYVAILFVCLLY